MEMLIDEFLLPFTGFCAVWILIIFAAVMLVGGPSNE